MKWKEYPDKAFRTRAVNGEIWADSWCCPLSSSVITKNFILTFTCDKAVLYSEAARHAFLEVSLPHKRAHGENSRSILPQQHRLENTLGIISHKLKSRRPNRKSRDGINPDSKFKSPGAAGADSWLSASKPSGCSFSIHGVLWLAACGLLSDYVFYLKLFFLSNNQTFHQVACLLAFEVFNLTCQCQPEGSSRSHISKWLWLNSLIILSTIGTHCYQLLLANGISP